MKELSCKNFAFAITATIAAAIAGLAIAQNSADQATLNQISAYRQWTRINAEPVKVDIPVKIDPATVAS